MTRICDFVRSCLDLDVDRAVAYAIESADEDLVGALEYLCVWETNRILDKTKITDRNIETRFGELIWKVLKSQREGSSGEFRISYAPEMSPGQSALDRQEGGDHYKKMGHYQPFEVLAKWLDPDELKGFAKGAAIAYLAREKDKGEREDIQKAVHTLQIYLELTEGEAL